MTLKSYLSVMAVLTAFCWGIFLFVARLVDPTATNWLGFLLFYLALFASLSGTGALAGFVIRFVALKKELAFNLVKIAFRQSFLFSLFIIFLLILKSQHLFNWLNLSLLIIIFTIFELFLISYKKNRYEK
ncbi:TPA: hypothetical protein DCZ15_00240 [Candidatus Falkowbacteria bacterium]|jgi:hypothetical protein|nr:MAG: hypothetical protein UV95_C0001G0279 [Candidatus Falkowbacteria bacterium GW2011_GWF2_43_32]HBA36290.1 hypothetical protein [Candidatus Falkowbacteria bacterium]